MKRVVGVRGGICLTKAVDSPNKALGFSEERTKIVKSRKKGRLLRRSKVSPHAKTEQNERAHDPPTLAVTGDEEKESGLIVCMYG